MAHLPLSTASEKACRMVAILKAGLNLQGKGEKISRNPNKSKPKKARDKINMIS